MAALFNSDTTRRDTIGDAVRAATPRRKKASKARRGWAKTKTRRLFQLGAAEPMSGGHGGGGEAEGVTVVVGSDED